MATSDVGSIPLRRARRGAVARPAAHERGVDVRIRLARRLLAPVAAVWCAQIAGDGVRRRARAGAQSRGGRGDARSAAGRSPATASNGSTTRTCPKPEERADLIEAIRIHTEVTGERPLGWYTGRTSVNSLKLGAATRAASSIRRTPMRTTCPIGSRVRSGPHVIVPYTLDANDMRFVNGQGFPAATSSSPICAMPSTCLYAEGEDAPKMMSVGLHCRLAGRPGRAAGLARFLDYIAKHDRVWIATRLDIARHWHRARRARRERLRGDVMQQRFPGTAQRRNPRGVRRCTGRHLRALALGGGSRGRRAAVRRRSRRFTIALSAARARRRRRATTRRHQGASRPCRQSGARRNADGGVHRRAGERRPRSSVGAEDYATFHRLNEAYKQKFGFPFIICVRRHTKDSILRSVRAPAQPRHRRPSATPRLREILRIVALRLDQRVRAPDRLPVHGRLSTHVLDNLLRTSGTRRRDRAVRDRQKPTSAGS